MTLTQKSSIRFACVLVMGGMLAACGGPDLSGVRAGSQAVHPSPSPLAQSGTPAECQYNTGGACITQ